MRDDRGDVSLVEGKSVLYKMCGFGPKCAIATGKPTTERKSLLQREALELALYSFRYLKGVDQVVVLLPPPMGADPTEALFFRRGDVQPELRSQLRATLPAPAPSVKTVEKARDWPTVDRITSHGLFKFRYAQAQDTEVYLVLEPVGSATPVTPLSSGAAKIPIPVPTPAKPKKKKKGK
jgi:hypothetical protein